MLEELVPILNSIDKQVDAVVDSPN